MGFLGQLRNQAANRGINRTSTWSSAVHFVADILRQCGGAAGPEFETRLLRLEATFGKFAPNPTQPPPPIRALPAIVVADLYAIFNPASERNPFKTETLRWRNLLIFLLLLRLGLRRSEAALLGTNAITEGLDFETGKPGAWLNVEATNEEDPRFAKPGLKTGKRQLPVPEEVLRVADRYLQCYRGQTRYRYLLISQKDRPLSLRAMNRMFETATLALSDRARSALKQQGLSGVSCHDLRHTCAVIRMRRYQDTGISLDHAIEKLRDFFGWTPESEMPRLYARAYFETRLQEVWDETSDVIFDALRRVLHRGE